LTEGCSLTINVVLRRMDLLVNLTLETVRIGLDWTVKPVYILNDASSASRFDGNITKLE